MDEPVATTGSDVKQWVDDITGHVDTLQQMVTDRDQTILALTAENQSLKDQLGKQQVGTLWGANYSDVAGINEALVAGRAQSARIFLQGLGGVKWSNIARAQRAVKDGVKTFVVSWKDQNLDNIKAFLDSIPDDLTVYACFNHEPENDHGNPGDAAYATWSKQWKDQWAKQSPVIREAGAIPTQILMGWTLFPASNRKLSEWTAPEGTVDVFGFDGYVNKFTPAAMVDAIVAATKAAGLTRTMIAETGSQVTDTKRTEKLIDLKQRIVKAPEQGVTFVTAIYWNAQDPGFDCRLTQKDADVWFSVAGAA
jgi:hypothetical protein